LKRPILSWLYGGTGKLEIDIEKWGQLATSLVIQFDATNKTDHNTVALTDLHRHKSSSH